MQQAIYQYWDYKRFIDDEAARRQISLKRVCDHIRIQPPFLSKVLRHNAHLTDDQLFQVSQLFNLTIEEEEFLYLLWREARAGSDVLRRSLLAKIKAHRESKLKLQERLDASKTVLANANHASLQQYFLNPYMQLIHMALLIPRYAKNPALLKEILGLGDPSFADILQSLGQLKIIEISHSGQVSLLKEFVHLDDRRESLMSNLNHQNWRVLIMQKRSTQTHVNYQFSGALCGSHETLMSIREELRSIIAEHAKKLAHAPSEMVYALNIDLHHLV